MHHLAGADELSHAFEQAAHNPSVTFGPGQRTLFFWFARGEILNPGPSGGLIGGSTVVVPATVIHVPVQNLRIHALAAKPVGKRYLVQISVTVGKTNIHWHSEFAGRAIGVDLFLKPPKLIAVLCAQPDRWLYSILPSSVKKQSFLRRKAQIPFFPLAILEHSQFFEQFTNVYRLRTRHRDVMRRPGVGANFILPPPRIAAGLIVHFQQDKIGESSLLETPCSTQACNPAADNHNGDLYDLPGNRKARSIPQQMTLLKGIVDEGAEDVPVTFDGEPNQCGTGRLNEFPA